MRTGDVGVLLVLWDFLGRWCKYPLNRFKELSEVGVSEFFAERVVGLPGARGDSHPSIVAMTP